MRDGSAVLASSYGPGTPSTRVCSWRPRRSLTRSRTRSNGADTASVMGIESLADDGQVQAIDVTGEPWIDVDTPEALREARRRLLQSLGKPGADGYVAAHLNRRLSVPISARLARTRITPTQITVISFLIALVGAGLLRGRSPLDGGDRRAPRAALLGGRRMRRGARPPSPSSDRSGGVARHHARSLRRCRGGGLSRSVRQRAFSRRSAC